MVVEQQQQQGDEIDVKALSQDKIKQLMKGDPNFIKRLIGQLDKQMEGMVTQKKAKADQIAADTLEIEKIESMIKSHVKPHLVSRVAWSWPLACMEQRGFLSHLLH